MEEQDVVDDPPEGTSGREDEEDSEGTIVPETDEDEDYENVEMMPVPVFNPLSFKKLAKTLKENCYYVVSYGSGLDYVGRVEQIKKKSVVVKFLERKTNDEYDWPRSDKIEDVGIEQFICGPIKLVGTTPFKILGVGRVGKSYREHMKGCQ